MRCTQEPIGWNGPSVLRDSLHGEQLRFRATLFGSRSEIIPSVLRDSLHGEQLKENARSQAFCNVIKILRNCNVNKYFIIATSLNTLVVKDGHMHVDD
jgi:metal-responsive CopG/Arc/MetJ family transcriptional regulator